jgi:hypothetical protein
VQELIFIEEKSLKILSQHRCAEVLSGVRFAEGNDIGRAIRVCERPYCTGLALLGGIAKFAEHAGETPPRELSG